MTMRDRDPQGRPRNARPRDAFGRPLPRDAEGVPRVPDDYAPSGDEAVAEAVRMLAEDRPFHAHEVLEARWKHGPEEERELWQGLAQICVGLTHLQRDNRRGAAVLLTRGAARITPYGGPARRPGPFAGDRTGDQPGDQTGGEAWEGRGGEPRTPYGMDLPRTVRQAHDLAAEADEVAPHAAIARIRATLAP
ncbi:hypothetical protein HNP84_007380 [Thermocatellispora tengchongensis]|uniref:DUF309 domain-containing protein n=1 Tax=Thermocatellispora tengchongensis TaxID=1073253 RepID=A0A840PDE0_9ACTN|nr:DUF309 domain-containing protein [Thermocatellispora tengchongensis]MBB5137628.1 hypothetical protein [Thermocatellispora tengchongensis]